MLFLSPKWEIHTAATALMDFPFSLQQYTNQNTHVLMPMSLSFWDFIFLCYKVVSWKFLFPDSCVSFTHNFFFILRLVFFLVYGLLLPKINTNLLYNSFDDMNVMHQICCILIGNFIVYICMYFIYVSVCVYACVRVCVYCCVRLNFVCVYL